MPSRRSWKIATVVIGLFVVGLSYLSYKGWIDVRWIQISYKGWIDVRWIQIENASKKNALTNVGREAVHALNNTAFQYATHSTSIEASCLPIASCIWIHARPFIWIDTHVSLHMPF